MDILNKRTRGISKVKTKTMSGYIAKVTSASGHTAHRITFSHETVAELCIDKDSVLMFTQLDGKTYLVLDPDIFEGGGFGLRKYGKGFAIFSKNLVDVLMGCLDVTETTKYKLGKRKKWSHLGGIVYRIKLVKG